MSQSVERLAFLMLCGLGAWAQQEDPKITVNVEDFRYPPIARSARIQGDVTFEVSASGVKLVDGNRILATAAQANLETWTLPPPQHGTYPVLYRFKLSGDRGREPGNEIHRFFLRLVHPSTWGPEGICASYDVRTETRVRRARGDDAIHVFVTAPGCLVPTNVAKPLKSRA
jgi:hypothetical protein